MRFETFLTMINSFFLYVFSFFLLIGCSEMAGIKVINVEKNQQDSSKTTPAKNETKPDLRPRTDIQAKASLAKSGEVKLIPKVDPEQTPALNRYCDLVDDKFRHYGWGKSHCKSYAWKHVRNSFLGRPLVWVVYGDEEAHKLSAKNTTMIFCTVHGDEITPTKFCFDIMKDLDLKTRDPRLKEFYQKRLIVVAPIVNPDSWFKKYPSRTNYRKVDVNRNFPTKDWAKSALKLWKTRYNKDPRRYPGAKPLSEQETIFQVNLIKRYRPHKLISVHAPLTILDYDGPTPAKKKVSTEKGHNHGPEKSANQLLIRMSKDASGYKIRDYPFFPGSLGNWAGNEGKIPTYTLELPTSDNRNHKKYWEKFKVAIRSAIQYEIGPELNVANDDVHHLQDPTL